MSLANKLVRHMKGQTMTIKTDSFGIKHEVTVDAFGVARNAEGYCVECMYTWCECD